MYDSRDENLINEHIDEATGHGIDFFNISWWGPHSWEDVTIKSYFLDAELSDEIKFCIFYESLGRLGSVWVEENGNRNKRIDLDDSANRYTLLSDFRYIAENYFNHPSYLKIDGRPVVSVYLARSMSGDIEGALNELRAEMKRMGFDIFILADEVYWRSPNTPGQDERTRLFDAVFAYNMHSNDSEKNDNFVELSLAKFEEWRASAEPLGVEFVPNVLPGFDKRFHRNFNAYPIERTPENLSQFMQDSLDLLSSSNMILITSYNEWHEGTQVEESIQHGAAFLNAIRESVLRKQVYRGTDLSGWEVVVGDGLYIQEGEHPVDIRDLETVHFGDYSELRANVEGRGVMAHNITFKRIRDDDAFKFNHRVKYEFRLPYEPIKDDSEFNPQTIEGSIQVWDGANRRIDYVIGFQWDLNPWDADYGGIDNWFGGIKRWQKVGFLAPDTSWHTFEGYIDFENNRTWISIDGVKYESELHETSREGLNWGRDVSGRLAAEIISIYPGETSQGAKHSAHFRNWSWIWEPH